MNSRKPWSNKLSEWAKNASEWIRSQLKLLPSEIREVIGGSTSYRMMNKVMKKTLHKKIYLPDLITPAYIIKDANKDLPSNSSVNDRFDKTTGTMMTYEKDLMRTTPNSPFTGVIKSILPILNFYYAEVLAMYFPIPLLPLVNKVFAVFSTVLEFGVRSIGSLFNWPLHKVRTTLQDKDTSLPVKLLVGVVGGLASLPFWGASVVTTLLADAISYTRTLLDSFTNLIILPFSYLTKKILPDEDRHYYPSFSYTLGTLAKSTMQLIPTALFIAFGISTAGLAFALKPALTVVAKVFVYPLYLGAMAAAAKIFSGLISKGWLALTKKPDLIPRHSRSNVSERDSNSRADHHSKSKDSDIEMKSIKKLARTGSKGGSTIMVMTHILPSLIEEDDDEVPKEVKSDTPDQVDNSQTAKPRETSTPLTMQELIAKFSALDNGPANDVAVKVNTNGNTTASDNSNTIAKVV